jgi:capsular polysaccharide biosynthesis protein
MNTGPLDTYLRELERLLRARGHEPSRLVAEAREHLADAVEDGLRRGLAREDAEREAVHAFGPPELIAAQAPGVRSHTLARLIATVETLAGHWRGVTAATAAAAALASAVSYSVLPAFYRSESMIAIIRQPAAPWDLDMRRASHDRMQALTATILSDARLDPLLKDFGLGTAATVRRSISVVMAPELPDTGDANSVFTVGFQSPDPQLSQRVAERLATLFIMENAIDAQAVGRTIGEQFRITKRASLPSDPSRPGMATATVSGAFAGLALSVVTLVWRKNPTSNE